MDRQTSTGRTALTVAGLREELADIAARLESLVAASVDAIVSVDEEQRIVLFSAAAERMFGYRAGEVEGSPLERLLPARSRAAHRALVDGYGGEARPHAGSLRLITALRSNGEEFDVQVSISRMRSDGRWRFTAVLRDLTAWTDLEKSRSVLTAIVESAQDGIIGLTLDGSILSWNPGATRIFGYTPVEMIGRHISVLLPPQQKRLESEVLTRMRRGERIEHYESTRRRKDGTLVDVSLTVSPIRLPDGKVIGASKIVRDIGDRIEAEKREKRQTAFYAALSQTNQAILHIGEPQALYEDICRICLDYGHATMAYIALVEGDAARPVAWAGPGENVLADIPIPLHDDSPAARGPIAIAIREGRHYISNDFLNDPATAPWRARMASIGSRATAAFPFRRGGVVAGALSLHVAEKDFFNDALVALLDEMASDLSFALDNCDRQSALLESDRRFRGMLSSVQLLSLMLDREGRITYCNDFLLRLTGWRSDEVLGRSWFALFVPPPTDERAFAAMLDEHAEFGHHESEIFTRMGYRRLIRWNSTVLRSGAGEPIGTASIGEDITESRRTEAALQEAQGRLHVVIDNLQEGLVVCDLSGDLLHANRAGLNMLGAASFEEGQHNLREYSDRLEFATLDGTPLPFERWPLSRILRGEDVRDWEVRVTTPDATRVVSCTGSMVRYADGKALAFMTASDITERKRGEARIEYLATHDALTDLPNRNLIRDRINQAIGHARRVGRQIAVIFLDLDRFKIINDAYGHPFGDAVLRAAGLRLASVVRDGDTVARQSGDEFLVLLSDLRSSADAYLVAQKILDAFVRPLAVEGREVAVTASLGVSVYPRDGSDVDLLIGNADIAMYRSKELGRNTFQLFASNMSEESGRRVELESQLRDALSQDQLCLFYQPKIDLTTGRMSGCEALLRWNHPTKGFIEPGTFIPIAEESGLIVPMGEWVLRTACAQNRAWVDEGLPPVIVAVNLSAFQFLQKNVVTWVRGVLQSTGLPSELLELELTESLIAREPEKVIVTIRELKAMGVRLSIDDFGTGYSSLSYLKRFTVDALKIDQSFVHNILTEPADATIARAVISLAHSLGLQVVAEGVETEEHCQFLRLHRCDAVQGFYFSPPVPPDEIAAILRSDRQFISFAL